MLLVERSAKKNNFMPMNGPILGLPCTLPVPMAMKILVAIDSRDWNAVEAALLQLKTWSGHCDHKNGDDPCKEQ